MSSRNNTRGGRCGMSITAATAMAAIATTAMAATRKIWTTRLDVIRSSARRRRGGALDDRSHRRTAVFRRELFRGGTPQSHRNVQPRSLAEQQFQPVDVTKVDRGPDRRQVLSLAVHVGTMADEQPHDIDWRFAGKEELERSLAELVAVVRIRAFLDELADVGVPALVRSADERRMGRLQRTGAAGSEQCRREHGSPVPIAFESSHRGTSRGSGRSQTAPSNAAECPWET